MDGALRWNQHRTPAAGMEVSGYAGLALGADKVYTAFSDGVVSAFSLRDGSEQWPSVDLAAEAEQGSAGGDVPRHLDVHLIMDNYGTHKTPMIRNWFAKRPRFHVHFTPTYGSWLNLVERWFADLTNKQLRRGVHRSVAQLKTAIREFIAAHHAKATPFVWTKSADEILASIARFAQRTLDFQAAPLIARTTRSGH